MATKDAWADRTTTGDRFGQIFGRATNNPNSAPVGPGAGLDPSLRRIVEQNTGTVRRNMDGSLVDPLKPTGLDWLVDNAGRGQTHSWEQPTYGGVRGSTPAEIAAQQRAGNEQTVWDGRGTTMRTPYGTASNVDLGDVFGQQSAFQGQRVPEGGTGMFPQQEGAQLAQALGDIFNSQAANPRLGENYTSPIPTSFDLTMPQQMEYHPQQGLPSFNPNDSIWQQAQPPQPALPNVYAPTLPLESAREPSRPLGQTQPAQQPQVSGPWNPGMDSLTGLGNLLATLYKNLSFGAMR